MQGISARRNKDRIVRARHLVFIGAGALAVLVRFLFDGRPRFVETIYSQGLYPIIAAVFSAPGKWVPAPYSGSELLIAAAVILLVAGVPIAFFRAVARKKVFRFFLKSIVGIAALSGALCFLFLFLWGFNYQRIPFSRQVNPGLSGPVQNGEIDQLVLDMVEMANNLHPFVHRYPGMSNPERLHGVLDTSVRRAISSVTGSPVRIAVSPLIKTLRFNQIMNSGGINGVFLPVLMEPHINADLAVWEHPCTMAHEIAHFMGYASETDANLIAYMACLYSRENVIRYSGAVNIIQASYGWLGEDKWRELVVNRLDRGVKKDINIRIQRFRKHRERFRRVMTLRHKANDMYLKANSQKSGMASYRQALPHLAAWWSGTGRRLSASFSGRWRTLPCRVHDNHGEKS